MEGGGDSGSQPGGRRTLGGGAALTSVAAVGTAAAGGLLGVLVARLLGPAETGAYNLASTTVLIGVTVFALGVNIGATYLVSARRWASGDALRQVQLAAALTGLLACAAGIAAFAIGRDTLFAGVPTTAVLIALAAIPCALSWTHSAAVALARDHYETFAFAPLAVNVSALLLAAVLTPLLGLEGAVAAFAGAHALNAVRMLVVDRSRLPAATHGWLARAGTDLRAAIAFGFKGYLPQTLQLLNYRADLFILNAYAASATVGRYAVALLVTEVGFLLPRSLAAVVMPRVAWLHTSSAADDQQMVIVKSVRHALVLAPAIAAALAIGVLAIPLVFGSEFGEAVTPGLILIPGVIAIGIANVLTATTVGKGRPEYALYAALLVTPPTMALYLWLIPEHGSTGAAVASTASYLVAGAMSLLYFMRATQLRSVRTLLPQRADLGDYAALWARGVAYLRERGRR